MAIPNFFARSGVILLFVHLIEKILEKVRIVAVLDHAKRESFEQRDVVEIMLQRPALQPFDRESAAAQLDEVGELHQLLHPRINDFLHYRINKCRTRHRKLLFA
jgi:hypothetical protein